MTNIRSKRFVAVFATILCVVLVATFALTLTDGISVAESESLVADSSLVIGHVSDIHYFPLEYCYRNVDAPDYEESDFFYSLTGDTKLVLESGMALNKAIHEIIEDARAGKAPHYLIASGDLSKNGERVSLIDLANALRYLQNRVRAVSGYEDFQVFATTGNHDLYNPDGAIYSQEDGKSMLTDVVSAMQFALIFAGLGYPDANLTGADGAIKLTDYVKDETYWYSSFTSGYQASTNSTSVEIHYYSDKLEEIAHTADASERLAKYYTLGDEINVLSFSAEVLTEANKGYSFLVIDSSDRTVEEVGTIVALGEKEYTSESFSASNYVYLENADGSINTSRKLTKASDNEEISNAFDTNKHVYRATYYEHITGGRVTTDCLDWMQAYSETQKGDKTTLGEETIVTVFHQNALPHWEQEDEILKDFTVYNWEYTAKRLLSMGSRYVLTGHMHASDVMSYTDAEGRTLYDYETGSMISYASPRRYINLERKSANGKLAEIATSRVYTLDNLKEIASNHIASDPHWNQEAYDSATTLDEKLASNPDFEMYVRRYDMLSVESYDDYTTIDIYSRLLDRALNHFISERMIDNLKGTLKNMLVGDDSILAGITGINLKPFGPIIYNIADYLLDEIIYGLYDGGYPFDGNTYASAIDYVGAIVQKFVSTGFGDETLASAVNPANKGKMTIKDIVTCISTAHAQGTEVKLCLTDEELQAEYAYIDAHFADTDCSGMTEADKLQAFKQPVDRTYRKRMTAAIKDLHEFTKSGKLVELLLDSLLKPLYYDDNSLLKTLILHKFDFSKAVDLPKRSNPSEVYLTESEYEKFEALCTLLNTLAPSIINQMFGTAIPTGQDFIQADNVVLDTLITTLMPAIKQIAASLIGFNLTGDTFTEAVDTALDGYLTESFYVGLGGIADAIIVAYATDVYPDVTDMTDISLPFVAQPFKDFKYAGEQVTYVSSKVSDLYSSVQSSVNPATQANGRVPSHVTSAFDTNEPTSSYTVKFYTAEDVFATFKLQTPDGTWHSVETEQEYMLGDECVTHAEFGGIEVEMTTRTKPQYIPLIDLGLACLTHGEVDYEDEDGNDVPYIFPERDAAPKASIIYWNETTVKIKGLSADTTYLYDLVGNYKTAAGTTLDFSLKEYSKANEGFTLRTAKGKEQTSFEFLAIADIQGMISGMYTDSFKAVEALMRDERTKNFDFVINAGDMVDNGKNFAQWGYALDTYQPLFANYSQIFCAGNHEGNTYGMTNFFDYATPTDDDGNSLIHDVLGGVYFSFDYANAHFVVLNTNDADTKGLGETQLEWLKKDLSSTTQKWKFVLMHKSIFSGGSHSYDGEVVAMREQLVPLFAENGVNIVFGGHDHTYTSTLLIDKDGHTTDKSDLKGLQYTGDGVLYITLGTMGTKYYEYGTNDAVTPRLDEDKSILHTLDSQTFGKVKVDGDKIEFASYYYDRATDSIKVVGESALVDHPVLDRTIAITLIVVIPTVVVVAGVAIALVILKTRGILGKK